MRICDQFYTFCSEIRFNLVSFQRWELFFFFKVDFGVFFGDFSVKIVTFRVKFSFLRFFKVSLVLFKIVFLNVWLMIKINLIIKNIFFELFSVNSQLIDMSLLNCTIIYNQLRSVYLASKLNVFFIFQVRKRYLTVIMNFCRLINFLQ